MARLTFRAAAAFGALITAGVVGSLLVTGAAQGQSRNSPSLVPEDKLEKLNATRFSRPTEITNEWLPMKPGTRFVYDGTTVEDDGKVVVSIDVPSVTAVVPSPPLPPVALPKISCGPSELCSYPLTDPTPPA